MKYLLIDENECIRKTEEITQEDLDSIRVGILTIIDVISEKECYYLDNDHQPVWEDIKDVLGIV